VVAGKRQLPSTAILLPGQGVTSVSALACGVTGRRTVPAGCDEVRKGLTGASMTQ
jgi:hypothetical protein